MPTAIRQPKTQKIPKLRFPGFSGAWEEKRLGEFFDITSSKRIFQNEWTTSGVPFYRAREIVKLSEKGYVNNELFISIEMFEKYRNKYGAPQENDILITGVGTIGRVYVVANGDKFYFKDGNIVWLKSLDLISSQFVKYLFGIRKIKKQISDNASVTTVATFTIDFAKKLKIVIPFIPEQQKIEGFLEMVDKWIINLRTKKESLESYKKGMMQKIFSQEICFKDDSGNDFPKWEEKKLEEICTKKSSGISANSLHDNNGRYKIYGASGFLANVDFFKEENPYIAVVKDGAGVGRLLQCEEKTSVLGTLDILLPSREIELYFLYALLSRIHFDKYIIGSTIPHIYFKDYKVEKMFVPLLAEQQKIAEFLTSLDNLIESKQQQITKAESWKKGLMQGLFV